MAFPRIQGIDVCGEIIAAGADIQPGRVGELLLGGPCLCEVGGMTFNPPWYLGSEIDVRVAEYVVVAARHAWWIDSPLSDVELAACPCSYSTAKNMLIRARVAAGDRVLVTGATGGLGSAAVQLRAGRGAEVITVTGEAKPAKIRRLGAEPTLGREENFVQALGRNSVEVVLDLVAGEQWLGFLEVLRPGGRYAVSGAMVYLDVGSCI